MRISKIDYLILEDCSDTLARRNSEIADIADAIENAKTLSAVRKEIEKIRNTYWMQEKEEEEEFLKRLGQARKREAGICECCSQVLPDKKAIDT